MTTPVGGNGAECPMNYEGFESAPSTRQLVRTLKADPSSVPIWQEASIEDIPRSWPEDDPEAENHLLALRSEMHALTALVVNDFAHELEKERQDNAPLGLIKAFGGEASEPLPIEDVKPTLDGVADAINTSVFRYSGQHLSRLREPGHPYKQAIDRLDAIINATTRKPDVGPTSNVIERDELQIFINGGIRTSTGVSKLFLQQIERLVRGEATDMDTETIADTAHRSYRLPLQLARLSLGTVLTYSRLIEENQPLVLIEEESGYRAAFSEPPNELFKKILDMDLEHPTVLGCPANVKIGKRMIDELWHWFIDTAQAVKVWDDTKELELVG